jgi:hypothetical protein
MVRRWNLNEMEGRYAKTNLTDQSVDLWFGVKCADGKREHVGRFSLDLPALAAQGLVTERKVAGGLVYDVQIFRTEDGTFMLGVRRDPTAPLSRFSVK